MLSAFCPQAKGEMNTLEAVPNSSWAPCLLERVVAVEASLIAERAAREEEKKRLWAALQELWRPA